MKLRPLHDRVVTPRIEGDNMTKGGTFSAETVKEKTQESEVVAVGPRLWDENGRLIAFAAKADNGVLFGKWSGSDIEFDDEISCS